MSKEQEKYRWFLIGYAFELRNGLAGTGSTTFGLLVKSIVSNNIRQKDINDLTSLAKKRFVESMMIKDCIVKSFNVFSISVLGDMTNDEFDGDQAIADVESCQ